MVVVAAGFTTGLSISVAPDSKGWWPSHLSSSRWDSDGDPRASWHGSGVEYFNPEKSGTVGNLENLGKCNLYMIYIYISILYSVLWTLFYLFGGWNMGMVPENCAFNPHLWQFCGEADDTPLDLCHKQVPSRQTCSLGVTRVGTIGMFCFMQGIREWPWLGHDDKSCHYRLLPVMTMEKAAASRNICLLGEVLCFGLVVDYNVGPSSYKLVY